MNDVVKVECGPTSYVGETMYMLNNGGLLLVSVGGGGRPNVMTIGWGLIGALWRRPLFMVAVRPSRYTYKLIEEAGDFTVNVPKEGMDEITQYCGFVSGRVHDKFKEKGLTPTPAKRIKSPIISECAIHYECKVIYKVKVDPKPLPEEVLSTCYPTGDYHTIYFGEIVSTYADEDVKEKIKIRLGDWANAKAGLSYHT